jgi:nucleoside-diphosphate-sugar epimerase
MQLFVTGGSGFIGRCLLDELLSRGHHVTALTRSGGGLPAEVTPVHGDLLEPPTYEESLDGCDAVIHLAAATGTASAHTLERSNVEGTEALLGACRRHGFPRFLFISSIAVSFPDLTDYPYARTKARAEEAVRTAGLDYLIVRPTAVFGPGSPTFEGLWRLAGLPVTPLFGGGAARIQPIHVEDLASLLADAVEQGDFEGRTVAAGGPEVIRMGDLLLRLRRLRGRGGAAVSVPLPPLQAVLRTLERFVPGRLPVTAGQLTSFRFDGIAGPAKTGAAAPARKGIETMVEESIQ